MRLIGSNINGQKKLNCRNSGNQPGGFTLIELLVVISIIALLISVLLPALGKAKRQAQAVVCASDLRQVGFACQSYAMENNDFAPPAHSWEDLNTGRFLAHLFPRATIKYPWQYYLWPYHKDFDIYRCPANPKAYAAVAKPSPWVLFLYNVPNFGNPQNDRELPDYLPSNFGYNNFVGGWAGGLNPYKPLRLSAIRSSTGLFCDTYLPNDGYRCQQFSGIYVYEDVWGSCNVDFRHGGKGNSSPTAGSGSLVGLDLRYGSTANVVFADCHCEPVRPEDAYWSRSDPAGYRSTIWSTKSR